MISIKFLVTLAILALIAMILPQGAVAQRNRQRNCPEICPALYSPVCAILGNGSRRDFASGCAASAAACQQNLVIVRTTPGNC